MKKILIIGSEGNLGTQVSKVFRCDYKLVGLNRKDFDFSNKKLLSKKIKELRPDIIINTSAYNMVDKCEKNDSEYEIAIDVNSVLPGHLAKIAIEVNAVLVHFSSDYVFSSTLNGREFTETDITNPVNRYGESKKQGEEKIVSVANNGLKYYIIRTSKLFGPLGKSKNSKPSFFDIMLKLEKEKDFIDVVNEEVSNFTYTPELAEHTKKLLSSGAEFGIYHFTNTGAVTWYEAVEVLFKLLNKKVSLNPVSSLKFPRPAKRPKVSVLKNTKFRNMRNWEKALEEYLLSKDKNI